MRLFQRDCDSWQLPYAAAAGGLTPSERLDLETHAAACPECADALRNARAVEVALRGAFSGLRERRATLAPGRVRVALGPREDERRRRWLRVPAFFGRFAEVSVMVGVTMFVVAGSFEEPRVVPQEPQSVIQEYFRSRPPADDVIDYFSWLRLHPARTAVRDAVRLPAGGLYDVEPAEIVKTRTATPR